MFYRTRGNPIEYAPRYRTWRRRVSHACPSRVRYFTRGHSEVRASRDLCLGIFFGAL